MDFEQGLRAELITVSGLTNKVFPVNAPEGTAAPYATYETGDHHADKAHDGHMTSGTLQCNVDVFGATYSSMKTTSRAVVAEIKTFIGTKIGGSGPTIQNLTFDEYLPELYEPNVSLYRKSIGFTVYF